jgi:phage shock protein A
MNLLGRLARVVRSQVNSLVQEAEDPEKMLDQVVMRLQNDLIQLRQAVAQAIATQKRTERQHQQTATLAQEWYNRAQLAVNKGDDAQAREALSQRQSYLKMRSQLAEHRDQQQAIVAKLKANMRDLEVKIADIKTRRDMYVARARSAEASQRIEDMMAQVGSGRSLGTISQMEDKVLNLEAQAEALADLNRTLETQSLEGKFAALEQSDADRVETELLALKSSPPERHRP